MQGCSAFFPIQEKLIQDQEKDTGLLQPVHILDAGSKRADSEIRPTEAAAIALILTRCESPWVFGL
jgi:hypothetical protein